MNERQSNYFWSGKMGRFAAFTIKLVLCVIGLVMISIMTLMVLVPIAIHHFSK